MQRQRNGYSPAVPEVYGTVLWLVPDKAASEALNNLIKSLSEKYKTPLFNPHLTLAGVPEGYRAQALTYMNKLSRPGSGFSVSLRKVLCGSQPYQKLMVQVEPTPQYLELCNKADQVFKGDYSKKENPHFSLLYGDIPCEKLNTEMKYAENNLPKRATLTTIALLELNGTPQSWNIISSNNLG